MRNNTIPIGKVVIKKNTASRIIFFALFTLALGLLAKESTAQGATSDVWIYRSKEGPSFTTYDKITSHPHQAAQQLYPGTARETWTQLLESGNVLGWKKSSFTRGRDVMEDWQISFVDPGKTNPTGNSPIYWTEYYTNNASNVISRPLTLQNGAFAGQSIIGNNNLIASGDDRFLFYNDEIGTLSVYLASSGRLDTGIAGTNGTGNFSWLTFSGGNYAGQLLSEKINTFIGYEEGYIYFLEGDNLVHRYGLNGSYVTTYDFKFNAGSGLEDYTLGDIVDGKIDGYTYLGWDAGPVVINVGTTAIPEPATIALFSGILMLCGVLFRRKMVSR